MSLESETKSASPESQPTKPPTFTDGEGRTWQIKLTLSLIDSVQAATQIDLAPDDNNVAPATSLLFNSRKLGAVLWECVRRQAESNGGLSREAFFDSLDADSLLKGWEALVDAIVFFIRSKSPTLAEAIQEGIDAELRTVEAGASLMLAAIKSDETKSMLNQKAEQIGKSVQESIARELANSVTS